MPRPTAGPIAGEVSSLLVQPLNPLTPTLLPETERLRREIEREAAVLLDPAGSTSSNDDRWIRRLFCGVLDFRSVGGGAGDPLPLSVLPADKRGDIESASLLARHEGLYVAHVRFRPGELMAGRQQSVLRAVATTWPGSIVVFSSYTGHQRDLCQALPDGLARRIRLDGNLFTLSEVSRLLLSLRTFDPTTERERPGLEVAASAGTNLRKIRTRRRRRMWTDSQLWEAVQRYPLLTAEQEKQLAKRLTAGEQCAARDRLILSNLRLAKHWAVRSKLRKVEPDDAWQEACCGLIRAVDHFDGDAGFKFSTYATKVIWRDLWRRLSGGNATISIPGSVAAAVRKLERHERNLAASTGVRPVFEEVAAAAGISVDETVDAWRKQQAWRGQRGHIDEAILIAEDHDPAAPLIQADTMLELARGLDQLEPRQAEVLKWRFGIGGIPPLTLQQCGDQLRLTKERIRQIEIKALSDLKKILGD